MQFCGVAIIETKNRAMAIVSKLEEQLDIPKKVRIHWTGCPNSCAQARPALGSAHALQPPCAMRLPVGVERAATSCDASRSRFSLYPVCENLSLGGSIISEGGKEQAD